MSPEAKLDALPIVDVCWLSTRPGEGWVMTRDADEPLEASRRFPIVQMIADDGDDTYDPDEAVVVVFGSDEFGWCTYELHGSDSLQ